MQKLNRWIFSIIPKRMILPLIWTVIWNGGVYWGARMIASGWYHYDMTTGLEQMIPTLPWTTIIYFGCYLFWVLNYTLSIRECETDAWRFMCSDFLGKLLCFILFLIIPTTNVRPEIRGQGFWDWSLRILYQADAADNLFPSIHCFVSWLSFIGVRKKKSIPTWYQIISCIMAILVFISTLTTKQHVLADVISGFLLAEGCYWFCGVSSFSSYYRNVFIWIEKKLFRKE